VQAACWLDIKRHYMERRPHLRRVYMALRDLVPYAAVARTLGIAPLPDPVPVGNHPMQPALLDMGPGSVDGWLSHLAAAELGLQTEPDLLDESQRALRVDGRLVPLTRREFDVVAYLVARPGEAVSRDRLIHDVWGLRFDAGSNVVDAIMASLRRKLGSRAGTIETVRGFGYLYRPGADERRSAGA
jgi:DNA-binding response OmpR family regulator